MASAFNLDLLEYNPDLEFQSFHNCQDIDIDFKKTYCT